MSQNSTPPKVGLKAVTLPHLVLSVIVAALIAAGDSAVQYASTSAAHFSLTQLLATTLIAFLGAMSTGVVSLEKTPGVSSTIDSAVASRLAWLEQVVVQHATQVNALLNVVHTLSAQQVPVQPMQSTLTTTDATLNTNNSSPGVVIHVNPTPAAVVVPMPAPVSSAPSADSSQAASSPVEAVPAPTPPAATPAQVGGSVPAQQ